VANLWQKDGRVEPLRPKDQRGHPRNRNNPLQPFIDGLNPGNSCGVGRIKKQ